MSVDPNSHQGFPSVDISKEQRTQSKKRLFNRSSGRRSFLKGAGLFTTAGVVAGVAGTIPLSFKKGEGLVQAKDVVGKFDYRKFQEKAYKVRVSAAKARQEVPVASHPTNGDETRYPNQIATDSRGLPHDQRGEVNLEAYNSLTKALTTHNSDDYEKIIVGGDRKLVNPQGPLAISLEGLNAAQIAVPPPPALATEERATEAVELYWQALLREVPFSEFQNNTSNRLVLAAVEELNKLPKFTGAKQNGRVTPQTLFRGIVTYVDKSDRSGRTAKHVVPPGVSEGPYISQFLFRNIPWGTQYVLAQIRTPLPENDFLTSWEEWLTIQNGGSSGKSIKFDSKPRYIFTVRDLAEYARVGGAASYTGTAILLSSRPNPDDPLYGGGIGAPLNPGNPYIKSKNQVGSAATFALGHLQALLPLGTSRAIRAAYWQKYYVHRTLRPEAYAGLIHNNIVNKTQYPIHSAILNSQALAQSFSKIGNYLLPQAYPDGAPLHSSYLGGAAVSAGVNITLLKAFFNEAHVIPNPVVPDPQDPTKLIPYTGSPLTVGGELNKLALNYAIGRGHAGIHWRSDGAASLALGEEIAISILKDERLGYNEKFEGFTFTRFDGTKVTV